MTDVRQEKNQTFSFTDLSGVPTSGGGGGRGGAGGGGGGGGGGGVLDHLEGQCDR